ncbi:hypothetical protein HDU96_007236 [Phlyctochytrium bullatum]|nr:hypothetical protein HDU96_007236 [Phlyctochytrium bullatum]
MLFASSAALLLLATTVSAEYSLFASYNGTATSADSCKQLSKEALKSCEKNFPRFVPNGIMVGHCDNAVTKYNVICETAQKPFPYAFKFPSRPLKEIVTPVAYLKAPAYTHNDCASLTMKSEGQCYKLYPSQHAADVDDITRLLIPTQGSCLAAATAHRDGCFRALLNLGKNLPFVYEFKFPFTAGTPASASASIVAPTARPIPTGTEEPVIEDPVTEDPITDEPVPTATSTIKPPPPLPTGTVGPVSVAMKVEGKASSYEECGRFQDQSVKKCSLGFPRWSPTGGAESGKCITAASLKADECRKAIDKKTAFDFEFVYPPSAASTKGRSAVFAGLEVDGDDEPTREGADYPEVSPSLLDNY